MLSTAQALICIKVCTCTSGTLDNCNKVTFILKPLKHNKNPFLFLTIRTFFSYHTARFSVYQSFAMRILEVGRFLCQWDILFVCTLIDTNIIVFLKLNLHHLTCIIRLWWTEQFAFMYANKRSRSTL